MAWPATDYEFKIQSAYEMQRWHVDRGASSIVPITFYTVEACLIQILATMETATFSFSSAAVSPEWQIAALHRHARILSLRI